MLCQECQRRQATLHFTKIINGKKTEFHICDVCAKEKGEYIPGSNSFSIHQPPGRLTLILGWRWRS